MNDPVVIGDCTLFLGDCLEILPTLGTVDAVVTDPPFGIGNFVQVSGNIRGKKVTWNDSKLSLDDINLIKSKATHSIIWGANYLNCFDKNGGAIIWDKKQPMPDMSKAEIASCTHNKKTEIVRIQWTNYVNTKVSSHPCERPVELYAWCIEYLPNVTTVLDPFLGSGSCGVACVKSGRKFIGIEIDPGYFDIACKRIEDAYKQGDMFVPQPAKIKQSDKGLFE